MVSVKLPLYTLAWSLGQIWEKSCIFSVLYRFLLLLHYREELECLQQFASSLIDVLKPPKSILSIKMPMISQTLCCQKSNFHKISHNSRAFLKSVQTSLHVVEGYFVTHHGLWYIILNQRIMALAMSKDFGIAPSTAEINWVEKFTLGLNHPVCRWTELSDKVRAQSFLCR